MHGPRILGSNQVTNERNKYLKVKSCLAKDKPSGPELDKYSGHRERHGHGADQKIRDAQAQDQAVPRPCTLRRDGSDNQNIGSGADDGGCAVQHQKAQLSRSPVFQLKFRRVHLQGHDMFVCLQQNAKSFCFRLRRTTSSRETELDQS